MEKTNNDCSASGNSISIKNYFKDLRKLDTISGDEQAELAVKAKNGDNIQRLPDTLTRHLLKTSSKNIQPLNFLNNIIFNPGVLS